VTPRHSGTFSGTVTLGVVLYVLEKAPEGLLFLLGQFAEHRDQHCSVAAFPMQKSFQVSDDHAPAP